MINKAIIAALGLLLLAGCGDCNSKAKVTTYRPVVRVFYHDYDRYSFLVQNGHELILVKDCWHPLLIADVPEGQPMWARITQADWEPKKIEIHLHDASSIDGGEKGGKHHHRMNVVE